MAHRVGVCGSCRARFQIPSTFTPNRARCRTCGGVVEIGATQAAPSPTPVGVEVKPEPRPVPAEVQAIRAPVQVEPRPAAPAPTRTPAPAPAVVRPSLARPPAKKRSVLVPALVAAGVLALLIFGAFQLRGRNDAVAASTPTPSSENEDAARTTEPKAQPSAAEDVPAPR